MIILEELQKEADPTYAEFIAKLTPNIDRNKFLGVQNPDVRKLAKVLNGKPEAEGFLGELPHTYYDENMLHGMLLCLKKDYDECVRLVEAFLPYVDNWAVCDSTRPNIFAKHKAELLVKIKEWVKSSHTYTIRFGVEMLMNFYLDADFRAEYLEIPVTVQSEEYYVNMMLAWYYATALSKQWAATLPYLEQNRLSRWVHNKTIQKALESYRITDEQKQYLRGLKK